MKNSYIISVVLALALIVLYILHFTSNKSASQNEKSIEKILNDSTVTLPIAYVNVDSLLLNYNFAKDLNEALMRKEESSRATLNQKESQLRSAQQEFQRKYQNNAFLSQQRAEQEMQRIQKMAQDFEKMAQQLTNEFGIEQQKMNLQLSDTVRTQLRSYNAKKHYQLILSNTASDNILYADDKYDITNEVVEYLNRRYSSSGKKKEEAK